MGSSTLDRPLHGPPGARSYFEQVEVQARTDRWLIGAARWRAVGCLCVSSGDGRAQRRLAKCPFHGNPAPPRPRFATYDPEADIFYLPVAEPTGLVHSVETTWGSLVDYDETNTIVGIELWRVADQERLPGALLSELPKPVKPNGG